MLVFILWSDVIEKFGILISLNFQDMGTIVLGKVESGVISKGQVLMLMPNKVSSSDKCTHLCSL